MNSLGLENVTFLIALQILSGLASLVFILVLTPCAQRLLLLDKPNRRKQHKDDVPMVGGLAIYLVILSITLILGPSEQLIWLLLSVSIIVAVGVLDDAFGLSVLVRFLSQLLATALMIWGGALWITSIGLDIWGLDAVIGWLGIPVTLLAVVGLTNGFNMADGIDGLASGHMLVGLGTLCLTLYITRGYVHQAQWLSILMSSVFVFWLVNLSLTPLKRVFLGDAGSLLLGFVMAWTLIYYTQKPVALVHPVVALWCITIPVFDTLVVIARRVKNKRSPFSPDRNHLHHLLVDMNMSPRTALIAILGLAIVANALGIWITYAISPLMALIAYGILLMGFGYGMLHPSIERRIAFKLRLID